ncbi:MAG: hypothetical protein ACK476_18430 [Fluviicola sp.]
MEKQAVSFSRNQATKLSSDLMIYGIKVYIWKYAYIIRQFSQMGSLGIIL